MYCMYVVQPSVVELLLESDHISHWLIGPLPLFVNCLWSVSIDRNLSGFIVQQTAWKYQQLTEGSNKMLYTCVLQFGFIHQTSYRSFKVMAFWYWLVFRSDPLLIYNLSLLGGWEGSHIITQQHRPPVHLPLVILCYLYDLLLGLTVCLLGFRAALRARMCVSADHALWHRHRHPVGECLSNWRQVILSHQCFFPPFFIFFIVKTAIFTTR